MSVWTKTRRGFPIQKVALKEDQLRWVGGFSSQTSLLLSLCDALVRILRVVPSVVYMWGSVLSRWFCFVATDRLSDFDFVTVL